MSNDEIQSSSPSKVAAVVEIKAIITSMQVTYKHIPQSEQWNFGSHQPYSTIRRQPQLDIEHLNLTFKILDSDRDSNKDAYDILGNITGNLALSRGDIKRLNLTVGDNIIIRVTKD